MAKLWPLVVPALFVASVAGAQPSPELSAIVFRIAPLSTATEVSAAAGPSPPQRAAESRFPASPAASAAELAADIEKQLATLDEQLALNGERSTTLLDPLLALAALYQDTGNQTAAITALQRAITVYRVNSGLHSLDQAGAVESLLATRRANRQDDEAATVESYLQDLTQRNPQDPRVGGVIARLADAEMNAAYALLDVPPPPVFNLVSGDDWTSYGRLPTVRGPALKAVLAARRHYGEAILAGMRNDSGNVAELFALQDRLIDTLYFELEHPSLRYYEEGILQISPLPLVGVQMLQAQIENRARFGQSAAEVAKAVIQLGDWYLIFAANGIALEQYEAAHARLLASAVPQSTIDDILSPQIPHVLIATPGTAADRTHHGYIDASISIGPYGTTRSVEILGASSKAPGIMEKRLRQYLDRSRFRPRFVEGRLARSDRFAARFYFDY